jgi:hypothetical protein
MRVMVRFSLSVESSNEAIRTGKLQKVMRQISEELKPEAGYFYLKEGKRSGIFVLDMRDSSQVAEIAERFFFGLNAKIEMTPVMNAEDLQKGLSGVEDTIRRYG